MRSPEEMPLTSELRAAARDSPAWQQAQAAEWAARTAAIEQQKEEAQRAKRQARAEAEEQERVRVRLLLCCVVCCKMLAEVPGRLPLSSRRRRPSVPSARTGAEEQER